MAVESLSSGIKQFGFSTFTCQTGDTSPEQVVAEPEEIDLSGIFLRESFPAQDSPLLSGERVHLIGQSVGWCAMYIGLLPQERYSHTEQIAPEPKSETSDITAPSKTESTISNFGNCFRSIVSDPEKGQPVFDHLIDVSSVVVWSNLYASAWQKNQHGRDVDNLDQIYQGRRECLVAMLIAGLDLTALGVAPAVKMNILTQLKEHAPGLHLHGITAADGRAINPRADQVLKNESVRHVVDSLLNSIRPERTR